MNLFIELKDGKPINHPISESNLRAFYPNLKVESPPQGFARFVKKSEPIKPPNLRLDYAEYVLDEKLTKENGSLTYTDNYVFRPYTTEEREELIREFKKISPNEKDWVFDEETLTLVPPIPKPTDGKNYIWFYPDMNIGETQGRWIDVDKIQPDNPNVVATIKALRELKEDMGLSDTALDEATKNLVLSLISDDN